VFPVRHAFAPDVCADMEGYGMKRSSGVLMALAVGAACLLGGAAAGGEAGNEEGLRKEWMELMRKRKAGQELTEQEMKRARELKEQMGARRGREGGGGREGRAAGDRRDREGKEQRGREGDRRRGFAKGEQFARRQGPDAAVMARLNVLDQAALAVADALAKGGKAAGALKELKFIIENSPDADAKSLANFKLGEIYRLKLDDMAKAQQHYYKVGGDLSERARGIVVGPLAKAEKIDEAIRELMLFAKNAPDEIAKAGAIRMMIELAVRSGDLDRMASTIEKARELMKYSEAAKAQKAVNERRDQEAARRPQMAGREGAAPWAAGLRGMKGGADGRRGPEAVEQLKMMIKRLEAAGRPEIAEKLKKRLEMMEKQGARGEGDGPAPPPALREGEGGGGEIF